MTPASIVCYCINGVLICQSFENWKKVWICFLWFHMLYCGLVMLTEKVKSLPECCQEKKRKEKGGERGGGDESCHSQQHR